MCESPNARPSCARGRRSASGPFELAGGGGETHAAGAAQPMGGLVDGALGACFPAEQRLSPPEHSRLPPCAANGPSKVDLRPFAFRQALSSARRLRRSYHGPYIDSAQPVLKRPTPTPSSPPPALTASGGTSPAAAGRPWRSVCATTTESALLKWTIESPDRALQEGTGLGR